MGEAPEWYFTLRAARYLGVAPWELERQSIRWQYRALTAETAETRAQRDRQKHDRG